MAVLAPAGEEAPATPQEKPDSPETLAVEHLTRWLQSWELVPSEGLAAIFAEAGRLLPRTPEPLLSTRLLVFAVANVGKRPATDGEGAIVAEASALIRRNAALFDELQSDYFDFGRVGEKPHLTSLDMSHNVERLLEAAIAEARERDSETNVLTTAHVFGVFPPESSMAQNLLGALGLKPDSLRNIVHAQNERVSTHADEPAVHDELGRQAFADILADRIREGGAGGAFIVHLHGPWGSGKSTILNFLEDNLCRGPEPWIVVRFNAWRDQRLQPPWWRLITTIYSGARAKLGWRAPWLWLRWLGWRIRADYLPLIAVALVALGVPLLLWWLDWLPSMAELLRSDGVMEIVKGIVPWALTVFGFIYVGSRTLALGSRRAAQTYAELKDDPFKPITKLFNDLVTAIHRPLVVFIDDLDRCDSKYVVELLEGIQTLMRGAAVTYVVAADRKWICSSFEQRYAGFSPPIGEEGRPLGYLFLDKLFQVSAAIPQIPADVQYSYWARLLSSDRVDLEERKALVEEATRKAEAETAGLSRQEELQELVREAEQDGDPIRIQAVRAACAKRISSPQAVRQTEHRLQVFAGLLEPNPRAMKRLVNAYAMHQATLLLAGRDTATGPLARWTILELRWPLLADLLAIRPECVDSLRRRLSEKDLPQVPASLRNLFGDELVQEVVGTETAEDRLTTAAVKSILGAVQGDR